MGWRQQGRAGFSLEKESSSRPRTRTVAYLPDRSRYLIKVEWFADDAGHEIKLAGRRLGRRAISGYQNDWQVGTVLANLTGRLPSVHFRHGQIGKHQVEIIAADFCQRVAAAISGHYLVIQIR